MSIVIDVVGKSQFDELVSSSEKLLFVDFWAPRCGPCRMLGPVLHDIAEKFADKVTVLKVNVDEEQNGDLAMQFQVRSIPQVTLFLGGKQIDQFVGVLSAAQIEEYIQKYSG